MSKELIAVMFANKEFSKAQGADFMAAIADSKQGLCPRMRKIYCVPMYSQEQVSKAFEEAARLRALLGEIEEASSDLSLTHVERMILISAAIERARGHA